MALGLTQLPTEMNTRNGEKNVSVEQNAAGA
jgi:hypothetical protein